MLAKQKVCAIGEKIHHVTVTQRARCKTFCARINGVTITVNQASNGVWHWASWCDSEKVSERIKAKFSTQS
jgi:hypothetical protein